MDDPGTVLDPTSQRILGALDHDSRATVGWLAQRLNLARGTVQSRIGQLFAPGVLRRHSVTIRPATLGFPMRAIVTVELDQDQFEPAMGALGEIPEILECVATSGVNDLLCQVVARDADDLYQIGQRILQCPGIRRTSTALVLRELIEYRTAQLLAQDPLTPR